MESTGENNPGNINLQECNGIMLKQFSMLPPRTIIARKLRKRRLEMRIGQRDLARRLGCSQAYLYQVEHAKRPLSAQFAQQLEKILAVKAGSYTLTIARGRPPMSQAARKILAELRRSHGSPKEVEHDGMKPRHLRSDWGNPVENPFWPMAIHLGEEAGQRVRQLEVARRHDERFWRLANSLRFDSWTEKDLVIQVGQLSVELAGVSLKQVGCSLQVVCGKTGTDTMTRAYPGFLLRHGQASLGWFTQRCVRTQHGHRWPDVILVVAHNGRKRTLVVEVDGPDFHPCTRAELRRDAELAVPVLHVAPACLQHPDGLRRILDWACSQVA